jgi:dipeptidyl aminopeptidase/acylaminoacyl peptidase
MTSVTPAAVARTRTVAEPRWSPDGSRLGWIEVGGGRADLLVAPADGSAPGLVVSADAPTASVGAYGGGVWCWGSDAEVVYAAADGCLLAVPATGGAARVLARTGRAFAPAALVGASIAFCLEGDDACDVAVVPLDGSEWPTRVSDDADFAWDPAWSPDGRLLAWHEWNLEAMSWEASWIATTDWDQTEVVTEADAAAGQPRFSPDGTRLAYVSDVEGWWNVWVADATGADAFPVLDEPHEHAEPAWGPGQRSFAWSPDGSQLAINRNEAGFARLVVVDVDDPGVAREVSRGWHHGLDWGPTGIACVRSGARTPPQVVVIDPTSGARRVVARGAPAGIEADAVEPDTVTWRSGSATIHGLLFRPPASTRDDDGLPPLLVDVHGGPTGQARVAWDGVLAAFVARGWAVLRPNYRGSTGYGRAYRAALDGRWGERDVADVAAGIRAAARNGWCDPHRVAVAGGSAGGLTALLVCAHHGPLVKAGVSSYGVTDLFDLAETTHRFESRYLDGLVGVLPATADRYHDRSPVAHAAEIAVPVLVLQGDADPVVPPAQAQALVDAVRAGGGTVEHHVYAGEGHGWSRPDTVEDALDRTFAFLDRWVIRGRVPGEPG